MGVRPRVPRSKRSKAGTQAPPLRKPKGREIGVKASGVKHRRISEGTELGDDSGPWRAGTTVGGEEGLGLDCGCEEG